ncbi:MAG: hypothetical protein WA005_06335 [Candidatus Binataceae bacterium]
MTPDGRWHLFANGLGRIHHFTSADGLAWTHEGRALFAGMRPCLRRVGDRFLLFYELFVSIRRSVVALRTSSDLVSWSAPRTVLEPSIPWESGALTANGNPCLVEGRSGFLLYYSASTVFLRDCLFFEPRYIGVAEGDAAEGPFRKRSDPILSPSRDDPYRNLGAGAIKVFRDGDGFVGLQNGIYRDAAGASRSAILLLKSADGFAWTQARPEPILRPEGSGWKRAFVYQLDIARSGRELRIYYNARSGWFLGAERIGVAIAST